MPKGTDLLYFIYINIGFILLNMAIIFFGSVSEIKKNYGGLNKQTSIKCPGKLLSTFGTMREVPHSQCSLRKNQVFAKILGLKITH